MVDMAICGTKHFLLRYYIRTSRPFSPSVAGPTQPIHPVLIRFPTFPISGLPHVALMFAQVDFFHVKPAKLCRRYGMYRFVSICGQGFSWS
jgi:hypothetical protein